MKRPCHAAVLMARELGNPAPRLDDASLAEVDARALDRRPATPDEALALTGEIRRLRRALSRAQQRIRREATAAFDPRNMDSDGLDQAERDGLERALRIIERIRV